MVVDRERRAKLIKLIDEDAKKNPGSKYTFDRFCREHNLYHSTDKQRGNDVFINCVFHRDADPSLVFNEEKRVFHCLGCNAKGNYVSFVHQYLVEVEGDDISFDHFLNRILVDDPKLQAEFGSSSVFTGRRVTLDDFVPLERKKVRFDNYVPSNYLELVSLLGTHVSIQLMHFIILSMQAGIDVSFVYEQIQSGKIGVAEKRQYDLTEMEVSE